MYFHKAVGLIRKGMVTSFVYDAVNSAVKRLYM